MRTVVEQINNRSSAKPMTVGIGISTGQVIAGNIGTQRRANYSVLGTAVNVAARLEKAARSVENGILISTNTYAYVQDVVEVRTCDDLDVPGKDRILIAYEVVKRK